MKYFSRIISGLIKNPSISDSAFDWLRVLKYHMEIRSILRAKTETADVEETIDTDVESGGATTDGRSSLARSKLHSSFGELTVLIQNPNFFLLLPLFCWILS